MVYLISFTVSFCTIFLRGFQQMNIQNGLKKAASCTGAIIAVGDVGAALIVINGGPWVMISAGMAGALGIYCAMTFHGQITALYSRHRT